MELKPNDFCPECGIVLNNREKSLRFCQNCKHHWDEPEVDPDDDTDYFQHCDDCDSPDACEDFGCKLDVDDDDDDFEPCDDCAAPNDCNTFGCDKIKAMKGDPADPEFWPF